MLRRGGEADAERIAELHIASWRATYAAELSAEFLARQDVVEWADDWRACIAAGEQLLLAEEGTALVGFVSCGPARGEFAEPDEWEIYNLHVAPDRHGLGIGSKLFDAAAALGRERLATRLVLWVVETNHRARIFYESKGMSWDGHRQDHVMETDVFHEVRYRRTL
jgi:ribosomal protein S18 acetylase RimI-like enzyme